MKRFFLIAGLLALAACSSSPKKYDPRNPAAWSNKIGSFRWAGNGKNIKLRIDEPFELSAEATAAPPADAVFASGFWTSKAAITTTNPTGQIQTIPVNINYILKRGSCEVKRVSNRQLDVVKSDRRIVLHVMNGGPITPEILRYLGAPPKMFIREIPRDMTLTNLGVSPGPSTAATWLVVRSVAMDAQNKRTVTDSTAADLDLLYGKDLPDTPRFMLSGFVPSFHGDSFPTLYIACSAYGTTHLEAFHAGRWSDIFSESFLKTIVVENLNPTVTDPTADAPAVEAMPIQFKMKKQPKEIPVLEI